MTAHNSSSALRYQPSHLFRPAEQEDCEARDDAPAYDERTPSAEGRPTAVGEDSHDGLHDESAERSCWREERGLANGRLDEAGRQQLTCEEDDGHVTLGYAEGEQIRACLSHFTRPDELQAEH